MAVETVATQETAIQGAAGCQGLLCNAAADGF